MTFPVIARGLAAASTSAVSTAPPAGEMKV
jgi:hypothetical protein